MIEKDKHSPEIKHLILATLVIPLPVPGRSVDDLSLSIDRGCPTRGNSTTVSVIVGEVELGV